MIKADLNLFHAWQDSDPIPTAELFDRGFVPSHALHMANAEVVLSRRNPSA